MAVREITCTADTPWDHKPYEKVRVIHPDAEEVDQEDGWPAGDLAVYICPHCKHKFRVELPQ